MQYAEGKVGRVFVLRLEDGDKLPDAVEAFAAEKNIDCAACWLLGGLGGGDARLRPPPLAHDPAPQRGRSRPRGSPTPGCGASSSHRPGP